MQGNVPPEAIKIILVEDDEIDVEILRRRFEKENITNPVFVASNGVSALEMLRNARNGDKKLTQPYIMLLDINMPKMSGMELLKALREDEELKQSIVFILTTSAREQDKMEAYNLNAAGYFLKDDLDDLISLLNVYWQINKFPSISGKSV